MNNTKWEQGNYNIYHFLIFLGLLAHSLATRCGPPSDLDGATESWNPICTRMSWAVVARWSEWILAMANRSLHDKI